jgi:putative ABC transport system substrate-binding protein
MIKRREFIAVLGGAAAGWPLASAAQQPKVPTIGVLIIGNTDPEEFWRVFRQGLRDFGYVEGQNIRRDFITLLGGVVAAWTCSTSPAPA